MEPLYQHLKMFVASPGDVAEERASVENIVKRINDILGETLHINLNIVSWENIPPTTNTEDVQEENINKKIKECHFFLLILYKRYGTIAKNARKSNTEREIDTIIECVKQEKKKQIISYFKEISSNEDPGPQEKKIKALQKKLAKDHHWFYKSYKDAHDFEIKLIHDLYNLLLKMHTSSYKVMQLKKFWKFGQVDGQKGPEIAIIYPPVAKDNLSDKITNFWQKKLVPYINFEDYKALHKIMKNISMIGGSSSYRVYSKYNLPTNIGDQNTVWVCLPRQAKALEILKRDYPDRKFNIILGKKNVEPQIEWINSKGEKVLIKSPLYSYLKRQRPAKDTRDNNDVNFENIIAKDFAVVARFDKGNKRGEWEKLKNYFIAGLHGLGNWGAAWYIDRKYSDLDQFTDNQYDNIQILLEVIYQDGRISDVRSISDITQKEIDEMISTKNVVNVIKKYKDIT